MDGTGPVAGTASADGTGSAEAAGAADGTGPGGGGSPGDPERSDAELLRAHVDGDRDAFATLLHRHRDRLWAVALRTVSDREEAADALQDALLSAHRSAARFRGEAAVTTWLHRIVVNACLDRIRRRQAHPTVPLPDSTRPLDTARWQGGVEPAAPATDHDTRLVVRQALAELPVEQRAALVLVDLQGYSVAEVAEILGVAEGTVKSRCARGRARLALLLGHLRPAGTGRDPAPSPRVPSVTSGNLGSGGGVRSESIRLGTDKQVAPGRRGGRTDQDQEES
ncbi:RNA polymerase sigma factor SigM [Plantactinospora sp. BC1]|uniref:RNA polymerase sigma factor SigM n=1 Tax=Plantactinospora sp. BC1 TaxID=2108470 RepID=UPI000D1551E8|nr:RNA polymerase sigma factor SigM [Plantactinospora sp. BC1]